MTMEVPMKRVLALVLTTAFLCLGPARGWGQVPADDAQQRRKPRFKVMHMKNSQALLPAIRRQASSGNIIPLWNYSLVSPFDKLSYSGQMVGRSPFYHGYRSTVIQSYLIPVKLTFSDGTVLDPTTSNSCLGATTLSVVQNSPIFQTTDWIMNGVDVGTAQYIDAFQRANFWSDVSVAGNSYHNSLALNTLAKISISVPAADGAASAFFCNEGQIDINWWDALVENTILPSLVSKGVGPKSVPIFLFDSVELCDPFSSGSCGILGYHNAYTPGGVLQTYGVADFDNSGFYGGDISVLTHEVGEWMDDPLTNNPTPAWGNIGQVSGCQNNLEVGDPLTGTFFPAVTLGNFTYDPQELVFFSWFYRQSPSIGSGGAFSNNGTFSTSPPSCP
jgi:hypothetical protein